MKTYQFGISQLVLMLIIMLPMQTVVSNEINYDGINWVVLGESPLLDRSTQYLHKGQTARGLRYARKALQRQLSLRERQIAHHNLCLGYVSQDQMEKAEEHCQYAQANLVPGQYLKELSPGLYRVSSFSSADTNFPALEVIMARNLEIHGIAAENNRLVQNSREK